jgi:hypothetical protein
MRAMIALFAPETARRQRNWIVSPQHRTHSGRKMDIFIRSTSDDTSIVVEAKIRDSIKTYQLDAYVEHVVRFETGRIPVLIWLVQRSRRVTGFNAANARFITWNDVHTSLRKITLPPVTQFCADLVSCKIVVFETSGKQKTRPKTYKGCKVDHAVRILRCVRDTFNELHGDVEEGANTPLGLHIGRNRWNLYWKRRVWFYFEPTTQQRDIFAPYGFVCHLLLYHAQYDELDSHRIEQWSNTMARLGLVFGRNVHGKWNHGCDTSAPIRLNSKVGVKYIGARRPVDMLQDFDWKDDASAIAAGHRYLAWGLDVVDQCLRDALPRT